MNLEKAKKLNVDDTIFILPSGEMYHECVREGTRMYTPVQQREHSSGCFYVSLKVGGRSKQLISRNLVAENFMPKGEAGLKLRHLNGNRKDHSLSNLKYATQAEINAENRKRYPTYGELSAHAKLSEEQVLDILRLASTGTTQTDLATHYGVNVQAINKIVNGKRWKHLKEITEANEGLSLGKKIKINNVEESARKGSLMREELQKEHQAIRDAVAAVAKTEIEAWLPVTDTDLLFEVSTFGGVREIINYAEISFKRPVYQFLRGDYPHVVIPFSDSARYPIVQVHRLVAEAFLGPRPEGMLVNHINGIKTENILSNLEYATYSYNSKHAYALGLNVPRKGEENAVAKLVRKQAEEIREKYRTTKSSQRELATEYGISQTEVWRILTNLRW